MEKKDVVGKIVDVIRTSFEQDGFKLKAPNKFEKRKGDSLYTVSYTHLTLPTTERV